MFGNLNGWHLLIIVAVILLLFGAPKLPGLARSLGQSLRIFRGEMKQMKDDGSGEEPEAKKAPAKRTAASTSSAKTTVKSGTKKTTE